EELSRRLDAGVVRAPGTGIYMTGHPEWVPTAVTRFLRVFNTLHEQVVLFTVETERIPRVPPAERLIVKPLGHGCFRLMARYGFSEQPNSGHGLGQCRQLGVPMHLSIAFYVLSPERVVASPRPGMWL